MRRLRKFAILLLLGVAAPVAAQDTEEEAGGPLVRLLENTLSNESRTISVTGLEGALSSRATIEQIEVSDTDGVWLRLSGAVLDWNRLALVRGRFSVNELTAERIDLLRKPLPSADADLPAPEAQPFSMPELPVAIEIGQLAVNHIELGQDVVGLAATLEVDGRLTLADGALDTKLAIDRLDRPGDTIALTAGFANETQQITLDLRMEEAAGGLLSKVLKLPGAPPVILTAQGDGPVTDFAADIKLATDQIERVRGRVELTGEGEADEQAIAFAARLDGDLRPLLAAEYRSFFGVQTRLQVAGRREADGRIDVSELNVAADAVSLTGDFALRPDGLPARLNVDLALAHPDDSDVLLPVSGAATRLRRLTATAGFDADQSPDWTLGARLSGFSQPDLSLGTAEISANGRFVPGQAIPLTGTLNAALHQLGFADAGLRKGIGDRLTLAGGFSLSSRERLTLTGFELSGTDYRATIDAAISGLRTGFQIDGAATAELSDLTRFDTLAGQPVGGSLSATLTGRGAPLGGTFAFVLDGTGQNLRTGQDRLDPLITGQTLLHLDAERGPDGLGIHDLTLDGTALNLNASGAVRTGRSDLTISASLDDLGRILPDLSGPVTLTGTANQRRRTWATDLDVNAPGGATATIDAAVPMDPGDPLTFDVAVTEPAGGPISQLLNIPDRPALALTARGDGALTDFRADISLATAGIPRLKGNVTIQEQSEPDPATAIHATLTGDATPLLQQQFRDFFGTNSEIDLAGLRHQDGRIDLTRLSVDTGSLSLHGAAALSADGKPLRADFDGELSPASGARDVRLPVPGAPVTLRQATIAASLDGVAADKWSLSALVNGLSHPQASLSRLTLRGSGAIDPSQTLTASGHLRAGLQGLTLTDPALHSAIGSSLAFESRFDLPGDDTFSLSEITLRGQDIEALADLQIAQLSGEQDLTAEADLKLTDLARFSGLAQRPLTGSASATIRGTGALRPRSFDAVLTALLQDLTTGIPQADALLAGDYRLRADAGTRADGIDLRSLLLSGPALQARASGFVSPTVPDITAQATLTDLAMIVPGFPGQVDIDAGVTHDDGRYKARLQVDAPNDSYLTANASHVPDAATEILFDAQMNKLERFMPQFPGSLSARGKARRENGRWDLNAEANGPADIVAQVTGLFDETTGSMDATAKGSVQLAAANAFVSSISVRGNGRFDMALRGKPALENLTGTVTVANTSVAIPQIQNSIRNAGGTISLTEGRANVSMNGNLHTGGGFTVSGPVRLAPPFDGNIAIALNQLILTDEVIYRAPVSGQLTVSGPLAGNANIAGRIDIGETSINIGNISGSSAAAPIPPLAHVSEPGAVRVTRDRAGLIKTGRSSGRSSAIGLDVLISAPRKIFVRGRGLDAELGGEILIRGTTANIAPSGQIELIRGIMGLFGRRLELSKGLISLQGSLKPFLEFAATSSTNSGSATLEMAGELDDLTVTITSDPELPEDEALALLIFGNEYSELSPFKIAQIAAGLIALRGGGDFVGTTGREATGADSVSVANDSGGLPSLELGGYLSDQVYTDVAVNADGDTELNINLDVTDNLTLKGTVDNSSESGIGIFFDRDY